MRHPALPVRLLLALLAVAVGASGAGREDVTVPRQLVQPAERWGDDPGEIGDDPVVLLTDTASWTESATATATATATVTSLPTGEPTDEPALVVEERDSGGLTYMLILLLLSISVVYVLHRTQFRYLPESVGVIILGLLLGLGVNATGHEVSQVLALNPESFFLFLLPPIMFESGFSLQKSSFFQNVMTSLLFAVIGTIIQAFVTGLLIYAVGLIPFVNYDLPILDCLLFGALMSAVDPVATLAIFKAINIDPTLYTLVFGESVLNDAVAVVLYRALLSFNHDPFSAKMLGSMFLLFLATFFGSILVGTAIALASALILKHIRFRMYPALEFAVILIFAYAPYVAAESVGLSGIMAILFAGMIMSHYTVYNMSPFTHIVSQRFFRTISLLAEMSVFLYLGLAVPGFDHDFNLSLVLSALFFIVLGRAFNVFPLASLANVFRHTKISPVMQFIMFFSGLRGAIAFALAVNLEGQTENDNVLLTTTLSVVLISIVLFGAGTFPLLRLLEHMGWTSAPAPGARKPKMSLINQNLTDAAANLKVETTGMAGSSSRWPTSQPISLPESPQGHAPAEFIELDEATIEPAPNSPRNQPFQRAIGWFEKVDNRWLKPFFRVRKSREMYREAQEEIRLATLDWTRSSPAPNPDDIDEDAVNGVATHGGQREEDDESLVNGADDIVFER